MALYEYSISGDFPNQIVHVVGLTEEIRQSDITVALEQVSVDGDDCNITFKAELSPTEQGILDVVVAAHTGASPDKEINTAPGLSQLGNLKVEPQLPSGVRRTIVSHDFCDPSTWWQNSIAVVEEELEVVPNSAYKQYRGDHGNWICLTQGRVVDENHINSEGDYDVVITVNDVEKEEFVDYCVDYVRGMVKFEWLCTATGKMMGMGALDSEDVVKATYRYATDSVFTVQPFDGKLLRIASVEVQFTEDCIISTDTIFAAFAYNPYDLPNKVEVPNTRDVYKTSRDFISVGNRGVGSIPKFGGHMRGLKHETLVFPFDYKSSSDLLASQGAEIRLWLAGDVPHQGEYCTCTFYCVEEDE